MKIMTIVGARPNFMKAAPILRAIREHNDALSQRLQCSQDGAPAIQHVFVHTGQHYDQAMSDLFFTDLGLPRPDVHLGVGSGSHAQQTAEIMKRFEGVLLQERPDVLLVVGDVNSTLACALVASKIVFDGDGRRPLIAHVEAGLRSFDRSMPEECNRVLTDHISDVLFVTEESGVRNLNSEGIPQERVHLVGNTMVDSVLAFKESAEESKILDRLRLREPAAGNGSGRSTASYALLTLHRPSNVDRKETFQIILEGISELSSSCPIVFPAHPRTRKRIDELDLGHHFFFHDLDGSSDDEGRRALPKAINVIKPLGYLDSLCLMKHASLVVTDSGGIQEETTCLGIPCVTVRENTERPVTVEVGTNVIAGVTREGIKDAIRRQLQGMLKTAVPDNWDGHAASRIVKIICSTLMSTRLVSSRAAH